MQVATIHIINNSCPELCLCGCPSRFSNYFWGRVVISSCTCKKCVAAFLARGAL